jgi:hypothetical protein
MDMNALTWDDACKLKEYCRSMIQEVNEAFRKSNQQIACLLIAPADKDGTQLIFNKFIATLNEQLDEQFVRCEECCVIAVIRDESNIGKPFYYYKILDNILMPALETD